MVDVALGKRLAWIQARYDDDVARAKENYEKGMAKAETQRKISEEGLEQDIRIRRSQIEERYRREVKHATVARDDVLARAKAGYDREVETCKLERESELKRNPWLIEREY